jgi:UDP-N-acetylmuramoylalanine--D-glutamate ligase
MDRYATLEDYCAAKQRIYTNCEIAVFNRDDPLTNCDHQKKLGFTLNQPQQNEFGLLKNNNEFYLAFEDKLLLPVRELPILGRHYQANALAALAIGYGYGLSFDPMLRTLVRFKGLPHRCQLIRERHGVCWYNDSKGTNVGAALAAIEGLGDVIEGKLILIAGGVGKNADFSPLVMPIEKYVKSVVLIGDAAPILATVIGDRVDINFAKTMEEAVAVADRIAAEGDSVLLSPACASLDMFNNFEHRGQVFTQVVQELA